MANISIRYQIAQKVRSWRLKRGYTQKDLAGKIGVTYQIVLQYEKGTRKISIEKLCAIAKVLSINITDLIPVSNEKICFEDKGEEILNLVRKYKTINDQELRKVFYLLGSVDKILEKPYKSSNKIEKTHKNLSSLVKSRKNAPKVLDFSKEAFNQMTFFVDMLIVIPLYFSIPSWWNNYYTSLAFKTCNKSITIVAFISH